MLQNEFLASVMQSRVSVTIYLVNGIRLIGQVESFVQYGLLLAGGASSQFIFKRTISTIVPAREIAGARLDDEPVPPVGPTTESRPKITRSPRPK